MKRATRQTRERPGLWSRIKSVFGARSQVYEAGAESRTRRGWTRSNVGPNAAAKSAPTLRARARDLVRNDAHAARAVTVIAGTTVGTGIEPRFKGDVNDTLAKAFRAWATRADTSGRISFDALQLIAMRAAYQDGECFVIRRTRQGDRYRLRLDVLEADMLDETKSELLQGGGQIVQGVEFAADGECIAYHFRRRHPGEDVFGSTGIETIRVLAVNVIHVYLPLRPQQVRGITFLAPSMTTKVDLADFERFHLTSKKMESLMTGWVIPGADALTANSQLDPDVGVEVMAIDADGNKIERMEPGMLGVLENGSDIRFSNPAPVQGYADFKRANLQTVAVGFGLTYELMTGDLSQVNYSSLRAGMLEFWRFIDSLQWQMFIPTFCQGVERWFLEEMRLTRQIPASAEIEVEWTPPKRQQVDPSKDILADYLRVRGGFASWASVLREHGSSEAEVIKDAADSAAALDEAGVVFDSDPRRYQWRGAAPVGVSPLPETPESTE